MENIYLKHILLIIGTTFILLGCNSNSDIKNNQVVKVEVEKIKQADATQEFAYNGTIEESETIPLSFSIVGTVAKVFVSEGEFVQKGKLLATLDNSTYQNAYAMAHATEKQAEDAYRRVLPMHKNGNVPDIKFVEVETALQQAKAAAAIAKKNLDDCNLFATTDGFIGKRSIEPGMTAMPNLSSITIVKINKVFARVSVAENEISQIRKGQKVIVSIGALGDKSFSGVVEEIGVMADPIAHSYKVKIGINNSDHSIKPGMICNAYIESPNTINGVVVPSRSILVDENNKSYVYIVTPQSKAVKKYVLIGQILNSGIEVTDGVKVDDQVVVAGQHKLVDGISVQIVN